MDITILNDRQRLGYFNIQETAKLLALSYQTVRQNIRRGDIPRPTRLIGRRLHYTATDVEMLAMIFGSRKRYKEYRYDDTICTGEATSVSGIQEYVT